MLWSSLFLNLVTGTVAGLASLLLTSNTGGSLLVGLAVTLSLVSITTTVLDLKKS